MCIRDRFFKRIIIIARNNGILVGDPFASYKIRLEKVDRGYLTEDEIKIILKKKMVSERLEHVRDLFIFACFTGLAYIDVAGLTQDNIQMCIRDRHCSRAAKRCHSCGCLSLHLLWELL